jgi:hypothetical protein
MKRLALVALLALGGCASSLVFAVAAEEGQEGIRIEARGGAFSGDAEIRLENVGKYTRIPENWKGPLPPGWTRQIPGE